MSKIKNHKSLFILLIGIFIGSMFSPYSSMATQSIKLIINNQEIQCDTPPQIINGRVMVPARFVAEPLGATVEWDGENKVVRITRKDNNIDNNQTIEQKNENEDSQQPNQEIIQPIQQVPSTQSVQPVISNEQNNPLPVEDTHPLKLDSVSETTYEGDDSRYKTAYVTVTITNTTDKYIPFIRLIPIPNINDGRNYMSALDVSTELEGNYYKPNSSVTLKYWTHIPSEINIVDWKLYN